MVEGVTIGVWVFLLLAFVLHGLAAIRLWYWSRRVKQLENRNV